MSPEPIRQQYLNSMTRTITCTSQKSPRDIAQKTSLLVPQLNRLYVAVSGKGKDDAKLAMQIYEIQP